MKVVLGYSGGLDTSVIVPWLRENYDAEVICMAGDVGRGQTRADVVSSSITMSSPSRVARDQRTSVYLFQDWVT